MALWNPFNLFKKKENKPTEAAAPAAEPAAAEPPVSEPPVSEPPVSEPPASEPPVSEPPVSEPPVTEPPVSEPPVSEPPVSEPPVSEPPVSEPPAEQPAAEVPVAETPTAPPASTTPEPAPVPSNIEEPPVVAAATAAENESAAVPVTEQEPAPVEPTASETTVTETASESKPADSPAEPTTTVSQDQNTTESEISAEKLVPFDEQSAPDQPVDLYEKISQKPTVEKAKQAAEETEAAGGLTGWFRSAISKTARVLNTDIRDLVGREGRLVDDEFLKELFTHLIKTDMGVGPATEIRDAIAKKYRARKVHLTQLIDEAKTTISDIMKQEEVRLQLADSGTTVIMVVGVNGSGKTTSIAKLAKMFRKDGKSVVLGAGDTFRAAAVEQLRQWAGRIGADIVTGEDQSDPASVAYKAAQFAKDNKIDICIVDTAGRLQTQTHLMQELAKIRRVLDKVLPGSPHETLLVLDSTAGQNAISQARGFSDAANCSGIVLAKLDGTAKGGVAIPIRKEFDLPVKFIGFGETADAIAPFDVPRYVDALFNFDEG